MRAMPSPTSSTRPTSRDTSLERYWSISDCRTETISSALNLMTASLNDLVADRDQPRPDRGVVEPISHLYDQAADQVGIRPHAQHRLLLESLAEFIPQAFLLIVRQRRGGANLHAHPSRPLLVQFLSSLENVAEDVEPLVLIQDQEEVEHE